MSQYKKKNLLIGGLLAVVVVMGIAYAAFASNLTITGTSSTTNNWGVRITSITPDKNAGGTSPNYTSVGSISQSYTDLTATFSAALISPGDTVTYTIIVENYGSLDAKLDSITMPESSNPAISFSKANIAVGDVITAGQTGNTKTFTVTVTYVDSPNQGQPASTTSNFTLALNFVQNDGNGGGSIPTPTTKTAAEVVEDMGVTTVITGDGLYDNGDGTYTYKGANPDNYLSFENNTWRILGIDSQGIKIISDEVINLTGYSGVYSLNNLQGRFDGKGLRDRTSNGAGGTYCAQSSDGCNAWAATANLVNTPAEFVNGSKSGTVLLDSELNTWLNGTYYTNTLSSNSNIIEGTFNVGPVTYNNNDLAAAKLREASYQWQGYVALATPSECLAANTNQTQCATESLNKTNQDICKTTNYLFKSSSSWWLVSPRPSTDYHVRVVSSIGSIENDPVNFNLGSVGVRPVLYLSSNITLTGNGTNDSSIYTIQ